MKKLVAILMALMMASMMLPALAEDGLTGEWYGNMFGVSATMTINEDGTYVLTAGGETVSEGACELKDGVLLMDGDEDPANGFAFDGETLSNAQFGVTFTRDASSVEEIVLADVDPDAALESFSGNWTAKYLGMSGMIFDVDQLPEEALAQFGGEAPSMTIDGTNVLITGFSSMTNNEAVPLEYADGALSFTLADYVTFKVEMLQDGMAKLTVAMGETEVLVVFVPAEAEAEVPAA